MEILAERMKALRKGKKLRQSDIAEALEIALISYQRYESGEREPAASLIAEIAKYYQVSSDYLLGLSDRR